MEASSRLRAWVGATLGPITEWTRLDAGRGSTRVFGLRDAEGSGWIVKQYCAARGFEQERRALVEWLAGHSTLGGARVPQLRADDAGLAALIVERLAGEPAESVRDDPNVARAAGRFLASLHELAVSDEDQLPIADALVRRTRAWLSRAALEPELEVLVAEHGPRPELFSSAGRVPCHRDFAPRNWLWDGDRLAVLDFEHARADVRLGDLVKLHVEVWSRRPELATAFFAGYGRALTDLEREQLRALTVLHGLATLSWGRQRGDAALVGEGRRALELGASWP